MGPLVAQSLAAFIATLSALSAGMTFGWASPSLPKLLNPDNENDLKITEVESSWLVSVTNIGCVFGPLVLMLFADRIGRKWSLNVVMLPLLGSWIVLGLATSIEVLYIGRFMGGISLGSVYALLPMYLGEIADDKIRGALGTLLCTMIYGGSLLSLCIGPWLSRGMLSLASAVPPIIFLILFQFMPESPYFLLMKGDKVKAHVSLVWLRRKTDVSEELATLQSSIIEQQRANNDYAVIELFRQRGYRKALGFTIALLTIQQLSGVLAIQSYTSLIFDESGLGDWSSEAVILTGIVTFVFCTSIFFVIDIAGRRPILIFSSIFAGLFLLCEGVFFNLKNNGSNTENFKWVPVLGIIAFYIAFMPGLGATPWAIIGEVFPTSVKSPATTILSIYGSTMGAVVAKIYQIINSAVGPHWVFYFFSVIALSGAVFVYFCVPETKKLSLDEIQERLNFGTSKRNIGVDIPDETDEKA